MMFANALNLRTYMYRNSERVHLGKFVILPRGCKFFSYSEILAANEYKNSYNQNKSSYLTQN